MNLPNEYIARVLAETFSLSNNIQNSRNESLVIELDSDS